MLIVWEQELGWHCEALEYHLPCWLGLGRSQQTCWACSATAGLCPAVGSSHAEWLWLCKAASWLLSEHPALPFSKWRSSWTSMFSSGYCSHCMKRWFELSESKALWIIFSPLMFCFLGLNWRCQFGCQNMYLRFCKGEEVCVFAVKITALCRLWTLYIVPGKTGYSKCWHLWRSSLFMSLSATAASEICCPFFIDWSWYLEHFECFIAQVSRIWNKINYNCYRQGHLWS